MTPYGQYHYTFTVNKLWVQSIRYFRVPGVAKILSFDGYFSSRYIVGPTESLREAIRQESMQ